MTQPTNAKEISETQVLIAVRLSDILSQVRDTEIGTYSKEEVAAIWAEAIEQKSEILGGLDKYLLEFMDTYTVDVDCEVCKGKGWIVSKRSADDREAVERCDACGQYSDDVTAAAHCDIPHEETYPCYVVGTRV